ncbi:hypothetical protein HanRHA438_Chr07g0298541 [Helianthus annuus]|nr:hypothetical protein HanRHA438_Chr07g0298541 [Helianthus annuus]
MDRLYGHVWTALMDIGHISGPKLLYIEVFRAILGGDCWIPRRSSAGVTIEL